MTRSLALAFTLVLGLALSTAAQAPAAPAAAKPAKVAVIFLQAALGQTNEGQRSYADLKRKYEPKQLQFNKLTDEIESLQKELLAQGGTLTNAERASSTKAIEDKKKRAQRFAEDTQNDFQREMQELSSGLATKVYRVLVAYARQHGYTLVLDGGRQQDPLVLFLTPVTDITKAIVDAYNLRSNLPALPVNPAAKPPVKH
jgi:outer membrane protein